MSNLQDKLQDLGDQITVLGWVSSHCQDNGLKTILDTMWHELMNVYTYIEFQIDEGLITYTEADGGDNKN